MIGKNLRNKFLTTTSQNNLVKKQFYANFMKNRINVDNYTILQLALWISFKFSVFKYKVQNIDNSNIILFPTSNF